MGQKVTVFTFLILIFGFTIATLVTPAKEFSDNENRKLQQAPKFSWETLKSGEFGSDYELYLTDQFVLRDTWIAVKTMSDRAMLKKDINGVYFGSDNYLFETHNDVDKENSNKNANRLMTFANKYGKQLGKDNVQVMIVPTAGVTLSDKMPVFAQTFDQNAYIDSIKAGLTDASFVDVREMIASKKNEYIYYKTDHHMTSLGNYYMYNVWAKANKITPKSIEDYEVISANDFAGTLYSKINFAFELDRVDVYKEKGNVTYTVTFDEKEKRESLFEMDAFSKKDKYQVFLGGNHSIIRINSSNKNGEKLLVVRDSYANAFVPFISSNYEEIIMVDFRYYKKNISKLIEEENINNILVMYNAATFAKDKASAGFLR
ncbi:MAG: hypothetical protein IKL73_03015 [Lachnospiraceae bacterium]|nr:hypothetical protein [Lachnospiraceae bacterium]